MKIHIFEEGLHVWIIILLTLTFIIFLIRFLIIKNEIKRAGTNYFLEKPQKIMKKNKAVVLIVIFAIFLLYMIVISIILRYWFFLILSILLIMNAIIMFNLRKKYENINGIYENGFLHYFNGLFEWKKIYSYNIIEKNLSGYFKDGSMFEYKNIENIDEIQCLFEKNSIKKLENS
jgi:hypothetical protein